MNSIIKIICILMFSNFGFAQNSIDINSNYGFQFGVSGKVQVEFNIRQNPSFKLSATTALGYMEKNSHFFPTVHTGIILFNRGPIGSVLNKKWHHLQMHFFYSALGTFRLDKRSISLQERYVPFYHFSDFTANPLHNPYKSSLSYGAIWVHMPKTVKQRIGFFNANITGRVQVSYYNDGGPILSWVGDKHDRYYTGGLLLSYHGNTYTELNLIELSYHKFTGYNPYAFDVGDKLQLDHLVYADTQQFAFNQQRWKLNLTNITTGYGGHISLYNFNRLDLQDFLHFNTSVPYHPDYYQRGRIVLGGRYEKNNLYLPR